MNLFVYGTLRDPRLVTRLTGRRFETEPAVLVGFRRVELPERYPYIEEAAGSSVEGVLIANVDPTALRALDEYEGEGWLYVRRPVECQAGGQKIACMAYIGIADRVRALVREERLG